MIKLKIADIVIGLKSKFTIDNSNEFNSSRYESFYYSGSKAPDIRIEVCLVKKLPAVTKKDRRIFQTRHPDDGEINWALFKNNRDYILREYLTSKEQHYVISQDFRRIKAFFRKGKREKMAWRIGEVIYDALQVILIHYLSRRDGIFTHAVGIKDNGRGLLFLGKSGQGKSTTSRLWYKHSRAKVLNDDRIIVRKPRNKFFIYGSPWHGDFSDYLATRADRARLKGVFFIFHSRDNKFRSCNKVAFKFIYPCLFPIFWDKEGLNKTILFCYDLIKNISCFRLGLKNSKEVIGFVRKIAVSQIN